MRALLVPLALALLLGSPGEVWADRTEAEYFAQRGDIYRYRAVIPFGGGLLAFVTANYFLE